MRCAIACAHHCTCLKFQRHAKRSMPCLIKKASGCTADHTSKTIFFIFHFLYNIKDFTGKSCVFICYLIGSVVKTVLYLYFFTQRRTDFGRLKRNVTDGTIIFLTATGPFFEPTTKQFISKHYMVECLFMGQTKLCHHPP